MSAHRFDQETHDGLVAAIEAIESRLFVISVFVVMSFVFGCFAVGHFLTSLARIAHALEAMS